ncbi:hypothetical protein SAMD00023353_4400140 [Rosellinia necatrix]|uniref:Uncharacterized protein n=1 Tax=Rosellinia necatrix TaxID=77044 RepID=A0A1W2TNG5_ROSNE|nr:hypothetical protein SAMD00023353_4400140 [Rosellinia necatrix]
MDNIADFWSYHRGRWNATKLRLRCISLVVSILAIALSVNQSLRLLAWDEYRDSGGSYYYLFYYFALPVTIIGTALDITELTFSVLRKRNPGLHPGWHIGVELALLGGNIAALIFTSISIPMDYSPYYQSEVPAGVTPVSIAAVSFLGLFAIIRFTLFIMGSIDTHRYHTAAQVELIVQTLRQQNLSDPTTAAIIHNSLYPKSYINHHQQPIPLQEFPHPIRPSHDLSGDGAFYPELPENQKFLVQPYPRPVK